MDIIAPTYEVRQAGKFVYIIPGEVVAWKRVNPGKGSYRAYDDQKRAKTAIGHQIQNQHGSRPLYKGILHAEFQFFMPIPLNLHKRKDLIAGTLYPTKPDFNDLVKLIVDVCQGILYENDSCIASALIQRRYDDGQGLRTQFYFQEVK